MPFERDPPLKRDQTLDTSRRALLQATGIGLAALACPRELRAAVSGSAPAGSISPIDFRFSPSWWQSAICLPDDPDKALVGKEGQLLFDWGVRLDAQGKSVEIYAADVWHFGLELQPDVASGTHWIKQNMASPGVPIIQTWRDADGIEISEHAFLVTPELGGRVSVPRFARADAGYMLYGWARPARESAPAFLNGAIGGESPIRFQLAVTPGASVTLVYGLCEGRFTNAGERPLVLGADGSVARTVDPVKDFGANQPGLYKLAARDSNHDGIIDIYVGTPAGAREKQPVLNALWAFSDAVPADEEILSGRADGLALASFPAVIQPARRLAVLMVLKNPTPGTATREPVLRIRSKTPVVLDEAEHVVQIGGGIRLSGSAPLTLTQASGDREFVECVARMPAVTLAPGESHEVVLTVDRHSSGPAGMLRPDQAKSSLAAARDWWEEYDLPYKTLAVPDRSIQDMLDSCVRNIWQARELKIGGPAFEVGPTCYRGLFIADGAFLLETVAILGRGQEARRGIEYMLSQQQPDGSFEMLPRSWKENGLVLWAATRHALLTQDPLWLRRYWPALERVMAAIRQLRAEASQNPHSLNYKLLPGGYVDGGIDNQGSTEPEYANLYWVLAGMKAFIGAARWLGEEPTAVSAQKEYDDFYNVFRSACTRDTIKDAHGNVCLPVMMGNPGKYVPQRGQWSFCHAVYPGQIFPKNDALVEGQLAMLRATQIEGLVYDTGDIVGGLWTYFASFYAHAQLWQGRASEALRSLHAFAQHACPTRVWREEQRPQGQPRQTDDQDGDMPHNWASAEFIRLTTHLIAFDRGDELHLLEGFPREWARAGMVTRLNGVATPFGPLHLEVRVARDGQSAQVTMKKLSGSAPAKVALHVDGLVGRSEVIALPTNSDVVQSIKL